MPRAFSGQASAHFRANGASKGRKRVTPTNREPTCGLGDCTYRSNLHPPNRLQIRLCWAQLAFHTEVGLPIVIEPLKGLFVICSG